MFKNIEKRGPKMKSLSFVLIMVSLVFGLGMTACTTSPVSPTNPGGTVGCAAQQLVDVAAAGVMQSVDGCTNAAQMESDMQNMWGSINLCTAASTAQQVDQAKKAIAKRHLSSKLKSDTPAQSGIIAMIVCPLAINGLDAIIGTQVPAAWGCTGSTSIDAAFTAACQLLPF